MLRSHSRQMPGHIPGCCSIRRRRNWSLSHSCNCWHTRMTSLNRWQLASIFLVAFRVQRNHLPKVPPKYPQVSYPARRANSSRGGLVGSGIEVSVSCNVALGLDVWTGGDHADELACDLVKKSNRLRARASTVDISNAKIMGNMLSCLIRLKLALRTAAAITIIT